MQMGNKRGRTSVKYFNIINCFCIEETEDNNIIITGRLDDEEEIIVIRNWKVGEEFKSHNMKVKFYDDFVKLEIGHNIEILPEGYDDDEQYILYTEEKQTVVRLSYDMFNNFKRNIYTDY